MKKAIQEIFSAGAGLVSNSSAKAEKIAKELIKKGELTLKDKDKYIADLSKKAGQAKKAFDKSVEATVKAVLKKLDIPTRKEIKAIEKEISKLQKSSKKPTVKKVVKKGVAKKK